MNAHSLLLFACAVLRGFPMFRLREFLSEPELVTVYNFAYKSNAAWDYIRNNRPMWTRRVR